MPDLTQNLIRRVRSRNLSLALPTTNGEAYYVGAALALDLATGRAVAISAAANANANVRYVGLCEQRVDGTGINTVAIRADGPILERESVVGVAGAASVGRQVYMTDDQTFTLARPAAAAVPTGIVSRVYTGTMADVLTFTVSEGLSLDALGLTRTMLVGTVGLDNAAATDVVCRQQLFGRGRIVKFHAYTASKLGGSPAGSGTFNLKLGGSPITNATLNVNATGAGVAAHVAINTASAVDARFGDGDVLTIALDTLTTPFNGPCAMAFYADIAAA